jgi:hypothetical protein
MQRELFCFDADIVWSKLPENCKLIGRHHFNVVQLQADCLTRWKPLLVGWLPLKRWALLLPMQCVRLIFKDQRCQN